METEKNAQILETLALNGALISSSNLMMATMFHTTGFLHETSVLALTLLTYLLGAMKHLTLFSMEEQEYQVMGYQHYHSQMGLILIAKISSMSPHSNLMEKAVKLTQVLGGTSNLSLMQWETSGTHYGP